MTSIVSVYAMTVGAKRKTVAQLRQWLIDHDLVPMKHVEHLGNEIRYRIRSSKKFKSFETEILPNGIYLVIGFVKKLTEKKSAKKSAKKR